LPSYSGLTIGYGDLAPKSLLGRVLAIAIAVRRAGPGAGRCDCRQGVDVRKRRHRLIDRAVGY
jgi:hypothetical protein